MKKQILSGIAGCMVLSIAAAPGFAGFEWRPPQNIERKSLRVAPPPARTDLPGRPAAQPRAPAPAAHPEENVMQPSPITPVAKEPLTATPAPMVTDEITWSPAPQETGPDITWNNPPLEDDAAVLDGFANHVSLVMALDQIIPDTHQFSYAPDVDLGQRVSWQGGRPWTAVLKSVLDPIGLRARKTSGGVIYIESQTAASPARYVSTHSAPSQQQDKQDKGRAAPPVQELTPLVMSDAESDPSPFSPQILDEENTLMEIAQPAPPAPAPVDLLPERDVLPTPVAAPPQKMPGVQTSSGQAWRAGQGEMLRTVLQRWAARSGVELFWGLDFDYRLNETIEVGGNFQAAVRQILDHMKTVTPRPYGTLHDAQDGSMPILIIKAYE